MDPNTAHANEDLWVFAYGSLMWRPDFPFVERIEALLLGAHRALCVLSFVHRGTPERSSLAARAPLICFTSAASLSELVFNPTSFCCAVARIA